MNPSENDTPEVVTPAPVAPFVPPTPIVSAPAPVAAPKPPTTGETAAASVRWPIVVSKDQFGHDHPAVVTRIAPDDSVDMIVFNQNGSCIGRFKVTNGFDPGQWHTYEQTPPPFTSGQLANAAAAVSTAQGEVDAAQDVVDNQQIPTTAAKAKLKDAKDNLAEAKRLHGTLKGA